MTGPYTAGGSAVTGEVMSAAQFQEELRHVARYDRRPPVENALALVVQRIKDNPALAQSRLLSRVLTAITYGRGEFRRAEASAFDTVTLGIVISLMNAARTGTTGRDDWVEAVTACDAAA